MKINTTSECKFYCCAEMKDHLQGLGEYYFLSLKCKYCPFCGQRMTINYAS